MSTGRIWRTVSTKPEDTLKLGAGIGRRLKGGEVIELSSDLGGGKTLLVRGLAAGLGSHDRVTSPSFTLSNRYQAGKLTLHHFDFYRLDEPGIMRRELAEVLEDPSAIVAVEWAGAVEDVLPAERLSINIRATGELERTFEFSCPDQLNYLLPTDI